MGLRRLRLKDLWPDSWYLRAYILVGLAEAIGNIAIESTLLAKFEFFSDLWRKSTPDEGTALPVYLGIFVLAHIFQIALAWEAIYNRNVIQIFGLCVFNAAFLIYAIIQISEIKQAFNVLDDQELDRTSLILVSIIPAIIAVAEAIYCYLSYYIYRLLGWEVFKKIGADRRIKRMYLYYQIFICILKFDFFFFFSFSLQFVLLVLQQSATERYLTLAAAPISIILLYFAYFAVRREHRHLMYAVLGTCGLAAGYFFFKLFRIYQGKDDAYRLVYKSLTVFSALCLALLVATFAVAVKCFRNFGFGLRQHLDSVRNNKPKIANSEYSSTENLKLRYPYELDSMQNNRMSIG